MTTAAFGFPCTFIGAGNEGLGRGEGRGAGAGIITVGFPVSMSRLSIPNSMSMLFSGKQVVSAKMVPISPKLARVEYFPKNIEIRYSSIGHWQESSKIHTEIECMLDSERVPSEFCHHMVHHDL